MKLKNIIIESFIEDCKGDCKNNNNNNIIIIVKDFYEYNIKLIIVDIELLKPFINIIKIIDLLKTYYENASLINIKKNYINNLKFS